MCAEYLLSARHYVVIFGLKSGRVMCYQQSYEHLFKVPCLIFLKTHFESPHPKKVFSPLSLPFQSYLKFSSALVCSMKSHSPAAILSESLTNCCTHVLSHVFLRTFAYIVFKIWGAQCGSGHTANVQLRVLSDWMNE